jgi:hypothetical protein
MPNPAYIDFSASDGGAGTSGDPYGSFSDFDSSESTKDLVTNTTIHTVYVKGTEAGNLGFSFSNWTTNSSYYVHVLPWSGSEGDASVGSWPTLEQNTNGDHIFTIEGTADFIRLEGMYLYMSGGGTSDECIRIESGSELDGRRLFLRGDGSGGTAQEDGVYIGNYAATASLRNCILQDFTRAGVHAQNHNGTNTQTWTIDSCLINNCGKSGISSTNTSSNTNNITVNNTGIFNSVSNDDYDDTDNANPANWSGDDNVASDTSATGKFTNSEDSITLTAAATSNTWRVASLTATEEDYDLVDVTGHKAIDVGTTSLPTDMVGNSRPYNSTADRGPIEYQGAPAPSGLPVGTLALLGVGK